MDNIVIFPKSKKNSPPQTVEEILENVEKIRVEHSDLVLDELIPQIYTYFLDLGIDVMKHSCTKENVMLMEAIRSLIYKHNNLDHPLQTLADTIFTVATVSESGISYTYNVTESEDSKEVETETKN